MAAASLVLTLVVVIAGVFLVVLSFVSLVKVLQIAEDVRYMRSKSDASIPRPKSYKNTLAVCLIVSAIIVFLVLWLLMAFAAGVSSAVGTLPGA